MTVTEVPDAQRAVWTEYQGIKVVDCDSNVPCRHPRWGYDPKRLAKLKGACLLALADDTWIVVCNDCGYNGLTGNDPYVTPTGEYKSIMSQSDSVLAHKSGTHWLRAPRPSMYTDAQIKVVIKVYLKWKASGIRNYTQAAATELNKLGFMPFHSKQWTTGSIGHLVRDYASKDKFRNIKAGPMTEEDLDTLAEMVRSSQAQVSQSALSARHRRSVATEVRITEARKIAGRRTPIDYDQIIAEQQAEKAALAASEPEPAQEVEVPTNNPTLTFSKVAEPMPTKTLNMEENPNFVSLAPVIPAQTPRTQVLVAPAPEEAKSGGLIQFVADVDGMPLFRYNGELMVGKKVKNFVISVD